MLYLKFIAKILDGGFLNRKMESKQKFLVISEKGLGDALTLLPSLRVLKTMQPGIEIQMIAPGLKHLEHNLKPLLRFIEHKELYEKSEQELHRWLAEQDYTWVWNTENQHSRWRAILKAAQNPKWVSATAHRNWPRKDVLLIRHQQLKILFPELSAPPEPLLPLLPEQLQKKHEFRSLFPSGKKLVAIQPGGADPNKVWPAKSYQKLINMLVAGPNIVVVLFLSPGEKEFFEPGFLPQSENLMVVSEPLRELVPKLAACDLYIGNDSGFYHLAYSLKLSVVGLYSRVKSVKIWSYKTYRAKAFYKRLPKSMRNKWKTKLDANYVYSQLKLHTGIFNR